METCKGCYYWKNLSTGINRKEKVCHYMIYTGHTRPDQSNAPGQRCAQYREGQREYRRWLKPTRRKDD